MTQPEHFTQLPRAYELLHSWGRFIVSGAAHLAYGLIPLRSKTSPSSDTNITEDITVLLVGPDEHPIWKHQDRKLPLGIHTRAGVSDPQIIAQRGIQIVCSFMNNRQEMLQNKMEELAKSHGTDIVGLEQSFTTEGGVPIMEHLDHRLGTELIHQLYSPIIMSTHDGLQQQRRRKNPVRSRLLPAGLSLAYAAHTVADDIHNDYCIDHFDQQYGHLLAE